MEKKGTDVNLKYGYILSYLKEGKSFYGRQLLSLLGSSDPKLSTEAKKIARSFFEACTKGEVQGKEFDLEFLLFQSQSTPSTESWPDWLVGLCLSLLNDSSFDRYRVRFISSLNTRHERYALHEDQIMAILENFEFSDHEEYKALLNILQRRSSEFFSSCETSMKRAEGEKEILKWIDFAILIFQKNNFCLNHHFESFIIHCFTYDFSDHFDFGQKWLEIRMVNSALSHNIVLNLIEKHKKRNWQQSKNVAFSLTSLDLDLESSFQKKMEKLHFLISLPPRIKIQQPKSIIAFGLHFLPRLNLKNLRLKFSRFNKN